MNSTTNVNQAVALIAALFADAPPEHYLEIRTLTPNGEVRQHFHLVGPTLHNGVGPALPAKQDGQTNVYYGVCPRAKRGGTAQHVTVAGAVWVDEVTKAPSEEKLGRLLRELNLHMQSDGRFAGACPFDHGWASCECESAFYISPNTGHWWCFCSDHPGNDVRTVTGGDLTQLPGFTFSTNGQQPDAPIPPVSFYATDLGNAQRLVARYGKSIRYCWPWKCWLVWDGKRWAHDNTGAVVALAKDTVKSIYQEVADLSDTDARAKLSRWAVASEAERRIAAMVSLARSDVPVLPAELDSNPWSLNVLNGILNLRTSKLHPHDPSQLITKLAPVPYDVGARYGLWDDFLGVAIPDPDTRRYVQKIAGISLTGDASEDLIVLVHGVGGTGKGTLRDALGSALGTDYAASADLGTFTAKRDAHGPQPDLARLAGVRLVTISEVESGGAMALLKRATGGDPIPTRSHHQETFEYVPQFTLWLMANERPSVPDTDTGVWRRMREIPFTTVFNPADPSMRLAMRDTEIAGPAVLAWAVAGCLAWQAEGLGQLPPQVAAATEDYRAEMDPLADFLEDRTVAVADGGRLSPTFSIPTATGLRSTGLNGR